MSRRASLRLFLSIAFLAGFASTPSLSAAAADSAQPVQPVSAPSNEQIQEGAPTAQATVAAPFDVTRAAAPSSELEERFFADVADGRLDAFSPLAASLVASGVLDTATLEQYEQKANALVDEMRHNDHGGVATREAVEAVFEFMHRRILRGGYHLESTDLRVTLDKGQFNCVTASILFNCLAGKLGIECRGLAIPGHAMSRVILPEGKLDLETTCPNWFRLTTNPKKQAETVAKTIGAEAAGTDRSKAVEVTPIQMAAMVYYNHGVDLLSEKRFADAAIANAKALRLDPQNATARGNLLATLNNWSIELGNQEHFHEAIGVLRQGLSLEPKYEAFAQNYVHVHHQWVDRLCRSGRFDEALVVLSRAITEMPDQQYLRRAQSEVSEKLSKAISENHKR